MKVNSSRGVIYYSALPDLTTTIALAMNILTTIARATTRRVGSRQLSATCRILSQQTRNYATAKKKSNNNMKINNNNKSPFKSVFGASSTATKLSNKFEIHQENTRSIFIQVESTPNPETLKFVPGKCYSILERMYFVIARN
jgi:hypothetical protein